MTRPPVRSLKVVLKLVVGVVVAVALGVAGATVSAGSPGQTVRANRQAAVGAADQLLGEVVLPAGATEIPSEPAGDEHQLERSIELALFAAEVDRHEFWTTTASPSAVVASIEAHLPAGAHRTGSGYSGGSMFVSYSLPAVGAPALGPRTLSVDAVELADRSTGVRADATVRYSAPRLPAQRVPAQAHVLEVAMTPLPFGHSPPFALKSPLVVTRRSVVRRIAGIIDGLPFIAALRGVAISCPAIPPAPIVKFTFRATEAGPALATVTEPANTPAVAEPCFTTALTIRGRRQPGLLDGGTLLRQAGAILGVKLTTRP
jgi:hypothetical protein